MDIRKIKKLIELLEESGLAEIEITEGEESVRIARVAQGSPAITQTMPVHAPIAAPPAAAPAGGFTIQVGVFKEKARAEALAAQLKGKGFAPTVSGGADGPFNVRVGSYADRADAEKTQVRLRDEEKLHPFIVKR